MKQIKEESLLIGKTIEKYGYDENCFALFFKDDYFAIFRGCGWHDLDVELMGDEFKIIPDKYNYQKLSNLGFISASDFIKIRDQIRKNDDELYRIREKEIYERLKKKYDE